MAVTLFEILESSRTDYKISNIAGAGGLNNHVSWIYVTEDVKNTGFLRGEELIITTGLQLNGPDELFHFIVQMIEHNSSGLIINIGKYIKKEYISPEIIDYCNSINYPLFLMPWEVHITDVMQNYCLLLSNYRQQDDVLSLAFTSLLKNPLLSGGYLETLSQHGFGSNQRYRILTVAGLSLNAKLHSFFNEYSDTYHILKIDGFHIVILMNMIEATLVKMMDDLPNKFPKSKYPDEIVGVGNEIFGIAKLKESYDQGSFSISVGRYLKKSIVWFDNLGIYQILFYVADNEVLMDIYHKHLGVLEAYDKEHNSNYLETLEIYLNTNGSIQETANICITHRNTINYRIRKIRELLAGDLDSVEVQVQLMMCFYIKHFLLLNPNTNI